MIEAIPSAVTVFLVGRQITPFESPWSTTTNKESKPLDLGRPVMRSYEICLKGYGDVEGIGFNAGTVGWVLTFFCWQIAQPSVYFRIYCAIPGHQCSVPIDKIEKVKLARLLRLGSLTVPTITHCDPSSLLLSLYLAFRDISWFMHANNAGPSINYPAGVSLTRDHILSSLHQLGALPFLTALEALPQRYANHHHTQQLFCTNCYHMGHRFLYCEHRQCVTILFHYYVYSLYLSFSLPFH